MKTKILSLLAIAALASGLTSCDDNWDPNPTPDDKQGQVSLASLGVEVSTAEQTLSRADVDLTPFIITITNKTTGVQAAQWTYGDMPELFALPVGDYTVAVKSHDVQPAEWDKPYYLGEKDFSIADSEITEIGVVTCQFASLKVTIKFSDELRAIMADDTQVSVVAGENGTSLVYTPSETRAGYFEVVDESTTLVATFTGTVNGYAENLIKTYNDVTAGQHWIITFTVKDYPNIPDEYGNIDPSEGINVDVSVETVDVDGNVDVDEDVLDSSDRPGKEDGGEEPPTPGGDDDDEAITFSSETLSFTTANSTDVSPAVVNIQAKNKIAHLVVKISSTSQDFINVLGDPSVDIPTEFDLAYPGDKADVYAGLGFKVGDEVIGATSIDFDITQFVPLLEIYEGTHTFTITVTDQQNLQNSAALTFVYKK